MAEKCQIFSTSFFASCETYNCLKKISWAIGRPDGPLQLQKFYCDDCMKNIVASIPPELLPQQEAPAPDPGDKDQGPASYDAVNGYLTFNREFSLRINENLTDPELKKIILEAVKSGANKAYTCKHCGQEFESTQKLAAHSKSCKAKGGKDNG